ncbi:hypothetical protein [Muriicola sp. Z0-33]|uniref:hypothetical protein n=1 Tax=Muriicola sp. Z0-33 TaxID=2816957 RepID=UPI002238EAB9|nr:hypothetical protein [Muriicola sp. Z0-33]MCW5516773.1 hypothetical protein [Muriicola sp. Z0-33]
MKKLIFTILLFGICFGSVQAQLNDYKYIIVPKKFDAFKRENQHLTSTLVKHLFTEKGYNAIYSGALPEELNNDRCLALTAQIKDESSMFMTKASIVLINCQSQEIYTTQQGTSKEKEYKMSYGEAIRNAFKSFDEISYSYTPATTESAPKPITVSFKEDVKQLPEDKAENEIKEEVAEKAIVAEKVVENKTPSEAVVRQEATPERQSYENLEPKPSDKKKAAAAVTPVAATKKTPETKDIWYAQEIPNGFQLVDSSPKVRLKMYSTSMPNVYLSENEKGNGLVYQKDGQWILEYYDGAVLKTEKLNIKF